MFIGFLALVFGYLGTFIHKGRMIAVSAGCMGCGSFLWILPHFLAGIYEAGAAETDLCDATGELTIEQTRLRMRMRMLRFADLGLEY